MWTPPLDALLQSAVLAAAFDFDLAAASLRASAPAVTAELCRVRFTQLQAGSGAQPPAFGEDDGLDLLDLLSAEDGEVSEDGLASALADDVVQQSRRLPPSMGGGEAAKTRAAPAQNGAPAARSGGLITDSSAFDFDADAALAEADAHIGAAIDKAMLAKMHGGGGGGTRGGLGAGDEEMGRGDGGVATAPPPELTGEEELARIDALSASRYAARMAAQAAMFDRVLGALGGGAGDAAPGVPLPAVARHASPPPAPRAPDVAAAPLAQHEDDVDVKMQSVTAAFHAAFSTRRSESGGGVAGGEEEEEEEGVASAFRGRAGDATLAAWDRLLHEVRLPEEGGGVLPLPSAASGGGGGGGGGGGRVAPSGGGSEMQEVLAILASSSAQSKQQRAQVKTRSAVRPAVAPVAPRGVPAGSQQEGAGVVGHAPRGLASSPAPSAQPPAPVSVKAVGAPVSARPVRAADRYGSSGPASSLAPGGGGGRAGPARAPRPTYEEDEEEEEGDIVSQRKALKGKASAVVSSAPAPSAASDGLVEPDGQSMLMQLLRAGRAASGLLPIPMASGGGEEEGEEGEESWEATPHADPPAPAVGVAGDGEVEEEQSEDARGVGSRAASSVAALLATVVAVEEALVHSGAVTRGVEGVEHGAAAAAEAELGGSGLRRSWVHSAGKGPEEAVVGSPIPASRPTLPPPATDGAARPRVGDAGSAGADARAVAGVEGEEEEDGGNGFGFSTRVLRKIAGEAQGAGRGGGGPAAAAPPPPVPSPAESAMPSNLPWRLPADGGGRGASAPPLNARRLAGQVGASGLTAPPTLPGHHHGSLLPLPAPVAPPSSSSGERVGADPSLLRAVLAGPALAMGGGTSTMAELQRGYMKRHDAGGAGGGGKLAVAAEGGQDRAVEELPRLSS